VITTRFAANLDDRLPFGILSFTLAQNLGDASRRGVVATIGMRHAHTKSDNVLSYSRGLRSSSGDGAGRRDANLSFGGFTWESRALAAIETPIQADTDATATRAPSRKPAVAIKNASNGKEAPSTMSL
jgi:hypothetical protein